eukprot:461810_1
MQDEICQKIDMLLSFIDNSTDKVVEEKNTQNKTTLETIKLTCLKISEQLKDGSISNALTEYKSILNNYIESKYETDIMKYLTDEWIQTTVFQLMAININHCTRWPIVDKMVQCCKLLMRIAVSLIKDNHFTGIQIITQINSTANFFKTFGCNYHEKRGYPLDEKEIETLNEWRTNEIKENSYIDYLFYNRWRYGLITAITQQTNESNTTYKMFKIHPKVDEIATTTAYDEFTLSHKTYDQISKPLTHFQKFGAKYFNTKGTYLTKQQTEELKEWRRTGIKRDCYVDYLYYNQWRYGKILEIYNDNNDEYGKYQILKIEKKMDEIPIENYYDEFILSPNTMSQICKPLTKSIAYKPQMLSWRKQLTINDKCDVLDQYNRWYTATVIEENISLNKIKIKYDGWAERWDCWIYRDDVKLQPYLSIAKGGREAPVHVKGCLKDTKTWIEDYQDDEKDDLYLIYRGQIGVSFHLVDIFNEFGKFGGFDAILQILSNKEYDFQIKQFLTVITSLLQIHKNYSKQFADKFIRPLNELVLYKFQSLSCDELLELTETDMNNIIDAVKILLVRYKSEKETDEICQILHLNLSLKKLKCASNERQIEAINFLSDVCSDFQWLIQNPKWDRQNPYICADFFNEWIKENNLVQLFFGPSQRALFESNLLIIGYIRNNYKGKYLPLDISNLIILWYNDDQQSHLIERSQRIMKYITHRGQLTMDHLESIYNAIENASAKKDEIELCEICDVIEHILYDLDKEQCSFLLSKLQGMESSQLKSNLSDLIIELKQHMEEIY